MTAPLLPPMALAPLRAVVELDLTDVVTLESLQSVRLPNGEYIDAWISETEQAGLLILGGAKVAELAAGRGVKATGMLQLIFGRTCTVGQRAMVRGVADGIAWQRLVEISSGTDVTVPVFGLATVVDVDLNQ